MPVKKGKLKPADEAKIRTNYKYLIEQIDALDVVEGLFQENVFTIDDMHEIEALPSPGKRTKLMLDLLLKSGPGDAYDTFVTLLRESHPDVVEKLEDSSSDMSAEQNSSWTWFDSVPHEVKSQKLTDADSSRISGTIGTGWEAVMLRLGLSTVNISHEKAQNPTDMMLVITNLLIRWRRSTGRAATLDRLVEVLKEVTECELDMEGFRQIISNMSSNQAPTTSRVTAV